MEMQRMENNTPFKTDDLCLATFLYCSGARLLSIDRTDRRRCAFIFETPQSELISKWQAGDADVNALAYYNGLQVLKRKIFGDEP